MKLGKLLGAGKSFFGHGGAVKYRVDRHFSLPKFNAEKNPFAAKPGEAQPAEPAGHAKPAAVSAPPVAFTPPARAARATRALGWKDKLNPFRTVEAPAPSMAGAVQPELSLEAVKVVRNDLADADIEVVPVKSQTLSVPEEAVLPPARHSWEFMGERLVKIG